MASAFTSSLNLELPARNDYQNQWDVPVNGNFNALDARIGGVFSQSLAAASVSGGTFALTQAQARAASFIFTGALTGAVAVTIPANCGGMFSVLNGTTGGYPVILATGAAGAAIALPPGLRVLVISDGTNVYLADQAVPPGTPLPWLSDSIPGGYILGYGQVQSQAGQPGIFAAYGTRFNKGNEGAGNFRMPDLRGKVFAGVDTMGGSAAQVLAGFNTVGQTGGEQNHTLSQAEMPVHSHGVSDPGHAHGVSDPGHDHPYNRTNTYNVGVSGTGNGGNQGEYATRVGGSGTGIGIYGAGTGIGIYSAGSGATHNNVQPTIVGNWIIKT